MYIYISMYIYKYIYICIFMYACMGQYMYINTYIHICIFIFIHTCIHVLYLYIYAYGVLTDGALTDGALTDGALTDGALTGLYRINVLFVMILWQKLSFYLTVLRVVCQYIHVVSILICMMMSKFTCVQVMHLVIFFVLLLQM